jgi:hypothetical protein
VGAPNAGTVGHFGTNFIVTACMFCNTADNRYLEMAGRRGLTLEGLTPEELVAQHLPYVEATRQKYREFWNERVSSGYLRPGCPRSLLPDQGDAGQPLRHSLKSAKLPT